MKVPEGARTGGVLPQTGHSCPCFTDADMEVQGVKGLGQGHPHWQQRSSSTPKLVSISGFSFSCGATLLPGIGSEASGVETDRVGGGA